METTTVNAAGLVVFRLDIHLWGGRQALRREQLLAANPALGDLPPSDLATMGSIHICDPEEVRRFARIKREAQAVVYDRGLPFLGAIAQPEKYFQATYDRLVELRKEFEDAAQDLVQRYDQQAQAWCAKWRATHPRYANLLKNLPSAQDVAGRLAFGFDVYRVASPTALEGHEAGAAFTTSVTGLKGELLRDVAAEANELMTKYLVEKDEHTGDVARREQITNKTLRPLRRAAQKLVTFGFLDPTVQPLAQVIDNVLQRMPVEGQIAGADLIEIWNLARTLANPSTAAMVGKFASDVGIDDAVSLVNKPPAASRAAAANDDGEGLAEKPRDLQESANLALGQQALMPAGIALAASGKSLADVGVTGLDTAAANDSDASQAIPPAAASLSEPAPSASRQGDTFGSDFL